MEKGSGETKREKVGKLTQADLKEIAQEKMKDLNTTDLKAAVKIVQGTAESMGVEVENG